MLGQYSRYINALRLDHLMCLFTAVPGWVSPATREARKNKQWLLLASRQKLENAKCKGMRLPLEALFCLPTVFTCNVALNKHIGK
jgi:hypothetical protein